MQLAFDVETEFQRYCGANVKYLEHSIKNHQLTVAYEIPGLGKRYVHGHLRNGTDLAQRDTSRQIAHIAFNDAYRLTGQRDRDMRQLLQKRTI